MLKPEWIKRALKEKGRGREKKLWGGGGVSRTGQGCLWRKAHRKARGAEKKNQTRSTLKEAGDRLGKRALDQEKGGWKRAEAICNNGRSWKESKKKKRGKMARNDVMASTSRGKKPRREIRTRSLGRGGVGGGNLP